MKVSCYCHSSEPWFAFTLDVSAQCASQYCKRHHVFLDLKKSPSKTLGEE